MRTAEEAKFAFTPVGKLGVTTTHKILKIENEFRDLALSVVDLVPESADRTAALRKLLEAKMTCVQAISHDKSLGVQAAQAPEAAAPTAEKKENGKKKNQS